MVSRFEGLFHTLYNYFSKSLKRHLEFIKFVKILKNVETHWIYMLSFAQHVMEEYKPLLIKITLDVPTNDMTKINFYLFCDVQGLLPLCHYCNESIT